MFNFPANNKTLIKLKEKKLNSLITNKSFPILINKIKLGKSKYYAYIISIIDLITLNQYSINQSTFVYDNKILPIPLLPKIDFKENLNINTDFMTVQVSRSRVFVLVSCNGSITDFFEYKTISNELDRLRIDYKLIDKESIKVFNSYLPTSLQIGRECRFMDPNFSDPYFPQLDDFDEFLCSELEHLNYLKNQEDLKQEALLDDAGPAYPSYWDSLDTSEKFEDNYDLAEQYFSESSQDNETDDRYNDYYESLNCSKPTIKSLMDSPDYLGFEEKLYDKDLSAFERLKNNLHCIYINDQLATFEYFVDDLYQNQKCFLNPVIFLHGIKVFSSYLVLPLVGELNFFVIQKPINTDISYIVKEVKQFNNCFQIEYPEILVLVKKGRCIFASDINITDEQDNSGLPF